MGHWADLLFKKIHLKNPYEGFNFLGFPPDITGSGVPIDWINDLIGDTMPGVIIEVGVWKGLSAIQMAEILRRRGLDAVVVCVDTWLGSLEHIGRSDPVWGLDRYYQNGYPMIYFQFLANVMHQGLQDYIVPFPTTSAIAARWFLREGIQAELINVDGSHDETDVYQDLMNFWGVLKPNGALVGDDYHSDWPGVVHAVNRFAQVNSLALNAAGVHWSLRNAASIPRSNAETNALAAWMLQAIEKYNKKDLAGAENEFLAILERYPQDPNVMVSLAKVYFETKRYSEARTMLEKVLQNNPDDQDAKSGLEMIHKVAPTPIPPMEVFDSLLKSNNFERDLEIINGDNGRIFFQVANNQFDAAGGEIRRRLSVIAHTSAQAMAPRLKEEAQERTQKILDALLAAENSFRLLQKLDAEDLLDDDLLALIESRRKDAAAAGNLALSGRLDNFTHLIRPYVLERTIVEPHAQGGKSSEDPSLQQKGRIPIAIPTYNRADYLTQVFEALRECDHREEFRIVTCEEPGFPDVERLIESIDFMPVERHWHKTRWGCSRNVCGAIQFAFRSSDVAVILEDDIVPARDFLNFMLWGLQQFQTDSRVISISGYRQHTSPPPKKDVDKAFRRHWFVCWGWATWKDRWERFYSVRVHNYLPTWAAYFWRYMFDSHEKMEIAPLIGRIQNIGEKGINVQSADWQRIHQRTRHWHTSENLPVIQKDAFSLSDIEEG